MTTTAAFPLSLARHPVPVRPNLADHLPEELPGVLAGLGIEVDALRARRLFASVVGRAETDLLKVTGLPHTAARAIASSCDLPRITVKERKVSRTDGFMKYLFELADGSEVEAVRIPIPCEPPDTEEGARLRD
jgi:adenine C2-methylase RlmN of 23S rRNA A2503 and tRNA A37